MNVKPSEIHETFVVEALKDGKWCETYRTPVLHAAKKQARYYRNKNECNTRIIKDVERVSYSYTSELVCEYNREKTCEEKVG